MRLIDSAKRCLRPPELVEYLPIADPDVDAELDLTRIWVDVDILIWRAHSSS